jgi:hypothetical protein
MDQPLDVGYVKPARLLSPSSEAPERALTAINDSRAPGRDEMPSKRREGINARGKNSRMSTRIARVLFLALANVAIVTLFVQKNEAWAWGNEGHEIVAIIAADNLTPAAREHVAKILGVSADVSSIEKAMAAASIRPDTQFREKDRSTAPWHFIDVCLQDQRSDIPARCPGGNCVTARIDDYARRLKEANYDKWGADGDLAFLIHFVGDVHQPLHATTDADRGGNCIPVDSHPRAKNLHAAWDTAVVYHLQDSMSSRTPDATAQKLEQTYARDKDADSWNPGSTNDIAWESSQIARSQIYGALNIPVEPCQPEVDSCTAAPQGTVDLDSSYMDRASKLAGQQLAKAGFRLASLLNQIWP